MLIDTLAFYLAQLQRVFEETTRSTYLFWYWGEVPVLVFKNWKGASMQMQFISNAREPPGSKLRRAPALNWSSVHRLDPSKATLMLFLHKYIDHKPWCLFRKAKGSIKKGLKNWSRAKYHLKCIIIHSINSPWKSQIKGQESSSKVEKSR